MYPIVQNLHSGWAYLVLLFLLIAVINAFAGLSVGREFSKRDRIIGLIALIMVHIQLVIGLILYFVSPMGSAVIGQMKDSALRLTWLEHPLLNIIGIILITIGWSKHKSLTNSKAKFRTFAVFYGIGLALFLLRIPYNLWFS